MNRRNFDADLITIVLYLGLVLMGWMTIYAVSSANWGEALFNFGVPHGKQMIWIAISAVAAFMILILDSRFIEASSYVIYGISIVALILTLFIGKEVNGAGINASFGVHPFDLTPTGV